MAESRKIKEWSEREFVINRLNVWYGSAMPRTIGAKELIDNAIDQVMDKRANAVQVIIDDKRVVVMDNGYGISTEKDTEGGKTHLYTAFGKLYSSSNYDGAENTTGTNGVGSSVSNFISTKFLGGKIDKTTFTGYVWENGLHKNEGEELDVIENIIDNPFKMKFYVEANYDEKITNDKINIEWIKSYTLARFGETKTGSKLYFNDEIYTKIDAKKVKQEERTEFDLVSWREKAEELGATIIEFGSFTYAINEDTSKSMKLTNMVQGAPVHNLNYRKLEFDATEEDKCYINIPSSFYYKGKVNPTYTDQTKQRITLYIKDFVQALRRRCPELYDKFKKEALDNYFKKTLKSNDSGFYFPSLGKAENSELIIAEGYSAISGIKARRNPQTQACLGLRGKITNVLNKRLKDAFKSEIIVELFTILKKNNFKKIILATDPDVHGYHIQGLIMVFLHKYFKDYLSEGKVQMLAIPKYIFNKGDSVKFSDKEEDKPNGYKTHVIKGLGGLTSEEIEYFIINENTRNLIQVVDTEETEEVLQFSYGVGARDWVIEDDPSEYYLSVKDKEFEDCLYE